MIEEQVCTHYQGFLWSTFGCSVVQYWFLHSADCTVAVWLPPVPVAVVLDSGKCVFLALIDPKEKANNRTQVPALQVGVVTNH